MQIRCSTCTKTIAIAPTGALPPSCPHCTGAPVPERLGDYVLDRLVATGGMGEVYLAHHDELGTEVAIKLLPAMPLDVLPGVRRRFAREARLTAKVTHPGVVRVLQNDVSGDRPFLVLEFVAGETLRHRLARGPLPFVEAARIAAATADVLAAAHAQGVLHRDVKPDNIMVQDDGSVRVLDFGIARAITDDAPLTRTGEIVGTPEYMAPEQLLDGPEATDARTDVHALGVLLHELLTGHSPFRGANVFQALKLVESLVPKPPSSLVAGVPEALDLVVQRALAKRGDERFATAAAFAAAVRSAVPQIVQPAGPLQHMVPTSTALRELVGIGVLAFVTSFCGIGVIWWLYERDAVADSDQPTIERTIDPAAAAAQRRQQLSEALQEGAWAHVLTAASDAWQDGDDAARPLARQAFVLSRAAWLRAAELPSWLAACDLGQRQLLFGDLLEPGDARTAQQRALLAGDDDAWQALLDDPDAADGAVAQLLRVRTLPIGQRADALAAYAQQLPIETPEHWLARTIERHLRDDRQGAAQAAEMAWLSGAGELAVLLEAALAALTEQGRAGLRRSPPMAERVWRRVAAGDHDDSPAGMLLQLAIENAGQVRAQQPLDAKLARAFPAPHLTAAEEWFTAAATSSSQAELLPLLRVAVALGAVPDFDVEPWQTVQDTAARTLLEQEARRER